jgi:hypothetical protein
VPARIPELFTSGALLRPSLLGEAKAHYVDAKADIDAWADVTVVAELSPDTTGDFWERAWAIEPAKVAALGASPDPDARVTGWPAALDAKTAGRLAEGLAAWVYRAAPLTTWTVRALGLTSRPGETGPEFAARVALAAREARDAAIEKVRRKYRPKLESLATKERTAAERLQKQRAQATHAAADSAIAIGATVFGAVFGTRRSGLGRAATAARSVSRQAQKRGDVERAQASLDEAARKRAELEAELAAAVAEIQAAPAPTPEQTELKARKADTTVTRVAIVWSPRI